MKVALISPELAESIQGKEFSKDEFFGPIEIPYVGWIISEKESKSLEEGQFELIDYTPPTIEEETEQL